MCGSSFRVWGTRTRGLVLFLSVACADQPVDKGATLATSAAGD